MIHPQGKITQITLTKKELNRNNNGLCTAKRDLNNNTENGCRAP